MPAIQGRQFAEQVLARASEWLPDSSGGVVLNWKRNGASSFPLLAGKLPDKVQLFGTHGRFRLTLPESMLAISEIGSGYELRARPDGSEYVHLSPDPFDVDLPDGDAFGSAEKPYGIDPITIAISCINLISGIWQLMHPQISLTLGQNIEVSVARNGDSLVASFNDGCPAIDAKAWFLRTTLRIVSAELSASKIRFRFAKNWTGVTYEDMPFQ